MIIQSVRVKNGGVQLIILLPNYSVLIVCDDTKVVGNGVSDCFLFPGQGLVEEPEDGLGELSEIGIKPVVRHMPVNGGAKSAQLGGVKPVHFM